MTGACTAQLDGLSAGETAEDSSSSASSTALVTAPGDLRLVASIPSHEDTGVAIDTTLRLTFEKPVLAGVGAIRLVTSNGLGTTAEVDVTETANVTFSGATVTIDWGIPLGHATTYTVEVDAGALVSEDGDSAFVGLVAHELEFQTEAAPDVVLQAVFPGAAEAASRSPMLTLVFNVDVVAGGTGVLSIYEDGSDTSVANVLLSDATQVNIDGPRVEVTTPLTLDYATSYHVLVDSGAIVSAMGAPFAGITAPDTFCFTTEPAPELTLIGSSPVTQGVAADDVAPNAPWVFTFDDAVVAGSGAVSVFDVATGTLHATVQTTDAAFVALGDTLGVTFAEGLAPATQYYLTLDEGVVIGNGGATFRGVTDTTAFVFTTASTQSAVLQLLGTSPESGATDVSVTTEVTLAFDANIVAGQGYVTLSSADGSQLYAQIDVTSDDATITGASLTVTLPEPLPGSTLITIGITPGAVVGVDGAVLLGLSGDYPITFETETAFGVANVSPTGDDIDPAVNLVLTFNNGVEVGTGSISVVQGTTVVETINLPDDRVTVSGATVTVDLDHVLAPGQTFDVLVDDGSFVDVQTAMGAPGFAEGEWTFSTTSVAPPADVSSGLLLWLDGAYSPSIKGGTSARLWADRSGQYRDVVQEAASQRPSVQVGAFNGKTVLNFDGADDVLRAASALDTSNLDGFIVWKSSAAPGTSGHGTIINNGANFEVNHSHPFAPGTLASCTGDACPTNQWYSASFLPAAQASQPQLWHFGYNSADTSLFTQSNAGSIILQTGPSTPPSKSQAALKLGGEPVNCTSSCYYGGQVAEVLLYSTPLTDQQRLAVTAYLYEKWFAGSGSCAANEYRGSNGKCYYYSGDGVAVDWNTARQTCQARGTGWDLAEARTELDHDELSHHVFGSAVTWVGASDGSSDNVWRWLSDGSEFWNGLATGTAPGGVFTRWDSTQPDDTDTGVRCMRYRKQTTWVWSDAACTEVHAYACQGPAD